MSFWEALQDQLRAKWWLVGLFGLEVLRQLHYLICERVAGYNQFWEKHVWGAWGRRMDKVNPWRRYRLNRMFKFIVFTIIAGLILAWKWGTTFIEAIVEAPARFFDILFVNPIVGLPLFFTLIITAMYGLFSLLIFYGIFMIGGIETYKAGEIKTRFRDVWGQDPVLAQGPGEHRLPREAGRDRGQGRLRAERHPPVGPARHRQDADGGGRRRRDRQAVRVRRSRRRSCRRSSAWRR